MYIRELGYALISHGGFDNVIEDRRVLNDPCALETLQEVTETFL